MAEKSKVPLYVLSAGELGTTPGEVDSALDKALECFRLWGAVLLLGEGDVFWRPEAPAETDWCLVSLVPPRDKDRGSSCVV